MRKILSLFSLWLIPVFVFAQIPQYTASGIVADDNGDPLIGAKVLIVGTENGAITDTNGHFSITNIKGNKYEIRFSYVGYKTKTITLKGNNTDLRITMMENAKQLHEVVCLGNVNAIDIREKSGVVSHVNMQILRAKPMVDIGLALQGVAPGLVVIPTGDLGSKPIIRIRGNSSLRKGDGPNQPLYVLDGKIISANAFLLLNPEDIKSIKILKDAAACAIYGVNAANGVIEITSKRGEKGAPTFTFSSNLGITFRGTRPLKMMNSTEKLEYERLVRCSKAPGYILSTDYINPVLSSGHLKQLIGIYQQYFDIPSDYNESQVREFAAQQLNKLRNINTDWFDTLLHNTFYQSYYMNLRGGNDDVSYYTSLSYSKQEGQLPGNAYQKLEGMLDLDWMLGDWGYISLSASGAYGKRTTPNGNNYSLESMLYNLNPYETPKTKKLFSYPKRSYQDLFNQFHESSNDISGSVSSSIDIRPIEDLHITGVAGVDIVYNQALRITPSNNFDEQMSGLRPSFRGYINKDKGTILDYTANIRATYHKVFAENHDITLSANMDYFYNANDDLSVTGYGTGKFDFLGAANMGLEGSRKPYFSNSVYNSAQVGYGASMGYTYASLLDLFSTIKMDASSVLPADKRWNRSWALGTGFHFDRLKFINNDILTDLTTRVSYGYIANIAGIQKSQTVPLFSYSTDYYNEHRSLEMLSMYNRDLRPEKTTSFDLGLSIGFVNRYSLSIQYYKRIIKDALLDIPIPSSTGYLTEKKNIGILMNKGVELSASAILWQTDRANLTLRGDMAYNNNLVIKLYDQKAIYEGDDIIPEYQEGEPYNLQWGWKNLGINPLTGIPMMLTKDGKQKPLTQNLSKNDFFILGRSIPPITGSLGISFSWRNFDFDCSMYYTLKGVKPYSFEYVRSSLDANKNAPGGLLNLTWFKEGDEHRIYPSPNSSTIVNNNFRIYPNSRLLSSSSFIKLSQMSIRYRIPTQWIQNITKNAIKYASIAVSGSNLFMLTPYNSGSPEAATTNLAVQPIITFNTSLTF